MAVYLVTGRLGAGKSLVSVGRIREALIAGRRVATNLDLDMVQLLGADYAKPVDCIRLPDKPVVDDLRSLGLGNVEMDESRNGVIVLDELAAWMNARTWGDKSRQPVIDWLIHSRKYGWDVIFICQHAGQIDKQVRESLIEFHVECRRLDRLRLPGVSAIGQLLSLGLWDGRLPRLHLGIVRYGTSPNAVIAERWMYRGNDLFRAYNTRQVFTDAEMAPWSYLPPRLLTRPRSASWIVRVLRRLKHGPQNPAARPVAFQGQPGRPGTGKHPSVEPLMRFPADRRTKLYKVAQRAKLIPE